MQQVQLVRKVQLVQQDHKDYPVQQVQPVRKVQVAQQDHKVHQVVEQLEHKVQLDQQEIMVPREVSVQLVQLEHKVQLDQQD